MCDPICSYLRRGGQLSQRLLVPTFHVLPSAAPGFNGIWIPLNMQMPTKVFFKSGGCPGAESPRYLQGALHLEGSGKHRLQDCPTAEFRVGENSVF